jgi:hypothetical protein
MLKRLLRWVVIAAMSHFWNLEASKVFTSELVQGLASEDVQHTAKIGSGAARVLAERLSDLQRSRIGRRRSRLRQSRSSIKRPLRWL